MLYDGNLMLKYKTYTIKSLDIALEAWKELKLNRGVWHLVGRKRQKGGFLPIFGAIAKPLLVSAAGAIGGEVLKGIEKIYFGEKSPSKKKNKKI